MYFNAAKKFVDKINKCSDNMTDNERKTLVNYIMSLKSLKCLSCGMVGHQSSACWFNRQMKDHSLPENVRISWKVFKEIWYF